MTTAGLVEEVTADGAAKDPVAIVGLAAERDHSMVMADGVVEDPVAMVGTLATTDGLAAEGDHFMVMADGMVEDPVAMAGDGVAIVIIGDNRRNRRIWNARDVPDLFF